MVSTNDNLKSNSKTKNFKIQIAKSNFCKIIWNPGPNVNWISVRGKSNYKCHLVTDSELWSFHFLHLAVYIQVWAETWQV